MASVPKTAVDVASQHQPLALCPAMLQPVRVMHQPDDVPEWVPHGGGHEAGLAHGQRHGDRSAFRLQRGDGARHVIDVPVHDAAARLRAGPGRRLAPVADAQFILVVTKAKLHVGRVFGIRPLEVRLDAQHLGVPRPRRRHVIRPQRHGGETAQGGNHSLVRVLHRGVSTFPLPYGEIHL